MDQNVTRYQAARKTMFAAEEVFRANPTRANHNAYETAIAARDKARRGLSDARFTPLQYGRPSGLPGVID